MDPLQALTDEQLAELIQDTKSSSATRLETFARVLCSMFRMMLESEVERRRTIAAATPAKPSKSAVA